MNKLTGIIALIVVGCVEAPEEELIIAEKPVGIGGGEECDENQCGGGNSPKFGLGNAEFHDLYLDPNVHPEQWSGKGYQIYKIKLGHEDGPDCTLSASRGNLSATCAGGTFSGSALKWVWVFVQSTTVVPQETYVLRLADGDGNHEDNVAYDRYPFWAKNNPPDNQAGNNPTTKRTATYKFVWRKTSEVGDWHDLCMGPYPSTEDNNMIPVTWLVAFEKDRINPVLKKIDAIDNTRRWLNLACGGSNPFKMHMYGLTEAAAESQMLMPGGAWPSIAQKDTFIKMMAGAYCGRWAWTVHGHKLTARNAPSPRIAPPLYAPMAYSAPISFLKSFEARWNKDGATCLTVPRVVAHQTPASISYLGTDAHAIRNAINAECAALNRPALLPCVGGPDVQDNHFLISANPP